MSEKMLREENVNKNDVQNILFFAVIQMGNHNEVVTALAWHTDCFTDCQI